MELEELQKAWDENRKESEKIQEKIKKVEERLEKLKKKQASNYSVFEELYYFGAVDGDFELSNDNKTWKKSITKYIIVKT